MKKVKYSSLSKSFYEDAMEKNDVAVNAITKALSGVKITKDKTNITDEELQILKKAIDILTNNIEKIEDYMETVEQFYNPEEVELD